MVALAKAQAVDATAGTLELLNHDGAVIVPANRALESVDISDLPADARARLLSSVDQFMHAHRRLNDELFQMSMHMTIMREILGDNRFFRFATEVLGFNNKRIGRLLKIYRVLNKHFTEADGKFHPNRIQNFSESALLMLADDTDSEVVELLQEMSTQGKVTASDVKKLLEQRAAEQDASIKALTAEAEQERRAAQTARERADIEIARERKQNEFQAEQLRRVTEQRAALEKEVQELQEQAKALEPKTEYVEKLVEVVPREYADKADALAGVEAKLRDATARLQRANADFEAVQTESAQLKQSLAVKQAGAEELGRLRVKVEELQMMFPAALLAKLRSTDVNVVAELSALGELLILTGKQFKGD